MNELAARGERANICYNEFVGPALKDQRAVYAERIAEIAVSELNPRKRADKITTLSTAIRILDNIDTAIRCLIEEGKMAERATMKVDEIERMTGPRRRLFEFMPY